MDHGSVYRRCGCRDENTGRLLGARCPGLRDVKHGSWYFSAELPSPAGERRRVRRGGFSARAAAVAALDALESSAAGPAPGLSTGEWFRRWLASRLSLRASTARSYAAHVRGYLVPYLGGVPLAALTPGDVQAMFTAVIRDETALGRPVSAATLHRIHATLRAALNGAAGPARPLHHHTVRPDQKPLAVPLSVRPGPGLKIGRKAPQFCRTVFPPPGEVVPVNLPARSRHDLSHGEPSLVTPDSPVQLDPRTRLRRATSIRPAIFAHGQSS